MVPSELGSAPFEEQIFCGPAHPPCDTPKASQNLPVPPASHQNLSQDREWAVCATPEIPRGTEQPTAVPWSESCQEQPQVTD